MYMCVYGVAGPFIGNVPFGDEQGGVALESGAIDGRGGGLCSLLHEQGAIRWPLYHFAIANIVWCLAHKRGGSGGKHALRDIVCGQTTGGLSKGGVSCQ